MAVLALTELRLSHFRSHKAARLDLDGRPVAIYGPNGAGKTNILEAVSLFSPGRGLRRAQAGDFARQPEDIGWKVSGAVSGHEIEVTAQSGAARQVAIDGKAETQTALGRIARMVWLVPSMDRLWIEGAEGRRRFLDRMTLSFTPSHAEASLAYDKAMRERNRLLKDMVRDAHWYVALERQMAEAAQGIQENRRDALDRLMAAQSSDVFPFADMVLVNEAPEDLGAALAAHRQQDLHAGRTLIGPHRVDLEARYAAKRVLAKQCSTGEQKALLISVILANARALAQDIGHPPIVLLDEVAAHLDAGRRAALYQEIADLGAQAWMTGTEAELFAELGDRAQYFEVTEVAGVSQVAERSAGEMR